MGHFASPSLKVSHTFSLPLYISHLLSPAFDLFLPRCLNCFCFFVYFFPPRRPIVSGFFSLFSAFFFIFTGLSVRSSRNLMISPICIRLPLFPSPLEEPPIGYTSFRLVGVASDRWGPFSRTLAPSPFSPIFFQAGFFFMSAPLCFSLFLWNSSHSPLTLFSIFSVLPFGQGSPPSMSFLSL